MGVKILLISRNAWNDKIGNTWTNFFQEFNENDLAQIYCRNEIPDNNLCKKYFKISESQLVKSIFKRKYVAGEIVNISNLVESQKAVNMAENEKKIYDFFRNKRLVLFLWLREILWKLGNWKTSQLTKFITDFNPDIIYTDAYDTFYTYSLLNYVKSITHVPFVIFHCDDQVTYRQFSLDPLYWINRMILRKNIRKAINQASLNYCIIDEQKEVYQGIFKKDFKVLNKSGDFTSKFVSYEINKPIRIIYAGNLFHGRWKTLSFMAKAIRKINLNKREFTLEIYTANKLTKKIIKGLSACEDVSLKGFLPYNEIIEVQKNADILLHVESFQLREKLITHLSFSTKIVDFFELGKCIIAIGWEGSAPVKYLKKNNAAITITNPNEIYTELLRLTDNPELIKKYGENAYECGKKNHNKALVLPAFRNDLWEITHKNQISN